MQQSIIDKIRTEYINQYLENSTKIDYSELTPEQGITKVLYKDLPKTVIDGYPIASDFVLPNGKNVTVEDYENLTEEEKKQCELRFYFLPKNHEIYIGSTGCGKTTGCIEPQLRAISTQKNKPSLFVTDPKGELFDHNAEHLKKQGYKIFVLNFKDLIHSDRWNPLLELYDKQIEWLNVGKNYTATMPNEFENDPTIKRIGTDKEFKKARSAYLYKNMLFPSQKALYDYFQYEKDCIEASIDSLVNQFANMMIIAQSSVDKSWEYGAQDLLKGLIQCMLDDAVDPKSGFTRDNMNLKTLHEYYNAIKIPITSSSASLRSMNLMRNKSEKAKRLMSTALDNAPNTMRSYCGVFDAAIKDWFQGHIFSLTTGHTIDLDDTDDKPFAIFLITRDYEKSDFLIASMFVDWVYRQILERVEKKSYNRALHFLLDEFGNIPKIKDFENKVSTSRSRNIWFHIVLQSYSQLTNNYGEHVSSIILDNCSQIFLGSTNIQTKEIFSKACGKRTIPSLQSRLSPLDNSVTEVPLIPVSGLNLIKPGQIYTLRDRMPVILSQFVRSYILAEQGTFADRLKANGLETCTPLHVESFSSDKYFYTKLKYPEPAKSVDDDWPF